MDSLKMNPSLHSVHSGSSLAVCLISRDGMVGMLSPSRVRVVLCGLGPKQFDRGGGNRPLRDTTLHLFFPVSSLLTQYKINTK